MSTSLTLPAWSETGISCSQPPTCYRPGDLFTIACCAIPRHRISILVDIPARAGLRPDASPRDTLTRATLPAAPPLALRAYHTDRSTPMSCSVSPLSTASHPRVGVGECIAAYAARRPGEARHRPPHGTRDSLPSLGRFRGQAPSARAPAAPAPSAQAPAARAACRVRVPPDIRVLCRVCIPLSTFPILLSLFSAVPAKSTS